MNQPCASASSMVLLIMPTARSAAGVTMTFAPRNRISLRRSTLNGSAMVITSGYPFAAQTMARPIPVFPLVASTTVCPGLSSPDFSAASITPKADRSFTEPRGLKASIFTNRFTPCGAKRLIRTTGVLPIVSRMFWYFRPMLHLPLRATRSTCARSPRNGSPAANDTFSDIVPDGASAYALTDHINFTGPEDLLAVERVERRLAAVLAADVAAYSRLMGRDEERTLANLKSLRKTLVDPAIATYRGRI